MPVMSALGGMGAVFYPTSRMERVMAAPTSRARGEVLERLTRPERFDLRPSGPGDVLDLGCGARKWPGSVGVDLSPDTAADVVHDLDEFPYPFEDGSFDQVLMQDVIEHVREPLRVMEELERICRPGARIHLRTPHFSSALAYGDPTHRHVFSADGVRTLAAPRFSHYTGVRLHVVHVTLDLWLPFRALGIGHLANRFPRPYECYLAFRFPAMNVRAEFEVLG
jgi:SAM-dependent methyltransferase